MLVQSCSWCTLCSTEFMLESIFFFWWLIRGLLKLFSKIKMTWHLLKITACCTALILNMQDGTWALKATGVFPWFHGHMLESAANVSKDSLMSNLKCCRYWLGQSFDLVTRKQVFESQTDIYPWEGGRMTHEISTCW